MKSKYGKIALVAILIIAVFGVIQLKRSAAQQDDTKVVLSVPGTATAAVPKATTVVAPQVTATNVTTPAVIEKKTPAEAKKPETKATVPEEIPTPVATVPAPPATVLPRLLELGSDSCRPCQMMQPVLAELRTEYPGKLQVDFIDVWKDQAAGKSYNIQSIPTQVFFDANGKEFFRHVGFYPKEEILAKFREANISL